MSLSIIIPIVVLVVIIICSIVVVFFLKKCVRWRAVSLVTPKRTMSDEEIIHNGVYSDSSTDGNYHSLGNLSTIDNTRKQISSRVNFVEGKEYPATELLPSLYPKEKNSLRRSFKKKLAYVASKPQEIIKNTKNMGVYNIPENELKYYKENGLIHEVNGETNINFEHCEMEDNLGLERLDMESKLASNSNSKINEVLNKTNNSITEDNVLNKHLSSDRRRKEVVVEPLSPKTIEKLEKCLQNKIVEVCITEKKLLVTEVITENNFNEITEQEMMQITGNENKFISQ